MASLLLAVIYVAFISLGLPDSLLGSAWPTMSQDPERAGGVGRRHLRGDFHVHDRLGAAFGPNDIEIRGRQGHRRFGGVDCGGLGRFLRYLELLGAVGHRHTIRPWRGRSGCGAQ